MEAGRIGAALGETVESLRDGVRQLAVEAALPVIEDWEGRLSGQESPELSAVAENLGALRAELSAEDVDAEAVGRLLVTLGGQVQVVANGPAGTQAGQEKLMELATLLAREGEGLSGR